MSKSLIVGSSEGLGSHLKKKIESSNQDVIHIFRESKSDNIIEIAKNYKSENISKIFCCLGNINLKSILSTSGEDMVNDFNSNLVIPHEIIKIFYRSLIETEGSIILFSSIAATKGLSFHSSISASKSAVEGYIRSLSAELAPKVNANVIRVALMESPMSKFIFQNERSKKISLDMQPMGKFIEPSDVADMALALSTNKSVNGQIITIDGGMTTITKKTKI